MKEILLATRNTHKVGEILALLDCPGLRLKTLDDVAESPQVEEDGATFEANAEKKAHELALHFRCWTMADDSGLVVDTLNGAPGVHSARYAGEHGNDDANNGKLLRDLTGCTDRTARFVCALALSDPEGRTRVVTAACEGQIASTPRGNHGFGYDPLFIPAGYDKTFGELGAEVKSQHSHRALAVKKAAAAWQAYFSS